jgi:PAS domain S-box-containing protein
MFFTNKLVKRLVSYFSISLGLLLILVSLFFTYENLVDMTSQNQWVTNTINLVNQTSQFELTAKDIQSNVRGYVVTGNEDMLGGIKTSKEKLVAISDTLFVLVENDSIQKAHVKQMLEVTSRFVAFSQGVVDTFRVQGREAASDLIRGGTGISLFANLSQITSDIGVYANIELEERRNQAAATHRKAIYFILFTGFTGFIITFLTLYFFLQDRKKQRLLKKQLSQKERLLKQYLEAIPDGIIVVNPSHELTYINSAGKAMLGYRDEWNINTIEDLMGKIRLTDPTAHDDVKIRELPLTRGLQGTRSTGNRLDLRQGDEIANFETSVEPIYEIDNTIVGAVSVFRDVTEREKYAENLKNARDIAEKSVKVRDIFLSNVSHEIRTPLNAILGFTNWLQNENTNPTVREYVGYIQLASNNLLELINDLLDISKIEGNQILLDKGPTSIVQLIESVSILIRQKAAEKGISYHHTFSDDLPKIVLTDKLRLTQILLNICGNAVKFTEKGQVSVEINTLGPVENGIQRIQFVITDTGIGIPKDKQELIFDRFVQASESINSRFGGTGLGLSISRALVSLLDGTLKLESETGVGTRFILEFDFAVSEDTALPDPALAPMSSTEYLASLHILAAEDNILNQKLLSALFQRVGTRLTIASNGLEAIELLKKEQFDLIIMDVQMPIMDGYTAIRQIRNTLKLDIPIITMTAHAMIGEKEEGARIGANSYISKPFREHELFNEIVRLTQSRPTTFFQQEKVSSSSTPSGATHVDKEYLISVTGGDADFRDELIQLFEDESKKQYSVIHTAFENSDYDALRKGIHALRSSLISVGLLPIAARYKEIEKDLTLNTIPPNLETLLTELEADKDAGLHELKTSEWPA